jgi:hypothetical protein
VFSAGLQSGVEELRARALELELDATVFAHTQTLPSVLDPSIYDSERQANEFIERCRQVGLSLLADDEKRDERALGYGNLGLLVLFPYNTPAQALTCLWASGLWKGVPWEPLLPRRRKR